MLPNRETSAERLRLTVNTGEVQSEIMVLDARGRLVERGFGPEQTFQLEKGIYRVKVLTGTETQEKSVVLVETPSEPLRFAPAAFASAAPLAGTSTSHEYHVAAADSESRKIHVADGVGSSLFFLVRDWTPNAWNQAPRVTGNPAQGLSLHAVEGEIERHICDLAVAGERSRQGGDPWIACTIGVNPGVYQLRLKLPGGDTLRQTFVASPGWQLQAFLFVTEYPSEMGPQWRADLSRTSVLLSGTGGFSPNEEILRVAELAKVALAKKGPRGQASRPVLPEEMRTLLRGKFDNPMLGIYGAHLLLLESRVDVPLLQLVVQNLRSMLGGAHPDVEALALRSVGSPSPQPFKYLPMLYRSWSLILDGSVTQPDLVTESLMRHEAEPAAEGPWCIDHTASTEMEEVAREPLDLSDVEAALAEDLGIMKEIRRNTLTAPSEGAVAGTTSAEKRASNLLFATLSDSALKSDAGPQAYESLRGMVVRNEQRRVSDVEVQIDDTKLRGIVARLGIPSTQVKRVLTNLEDKFTRNPQAPNLKVLFK